jgi:transposase
MSPPDEPVSAHPEEIESLLERVRRNQLGEQDLRLLERLLRLLLSVVRFLEQKNTSLARLKRLLFGPPPDPPSSAPPASPVATEPSGTALSPVTAPEPPPKRPGHGRLPGSAYTGATPVRCLHPQLHPGACCPDPFCGGRLFDTAAPAIFIRLTGQPLVGATRFEQQVVRCSTCQQRYTAPLPEGVPTEKYDATADVAIVMAKYAAGLPFHRLAQRQQFSGVPLPESVQWERCEAVADALLPVYLYGRALASEAEVLIGDDTGVQILSCCRENQQRAEGERQGLHTTGIVAQGKKPPPSVVLYTSGRQHAGENIGDLLRSRPSGLAPPLQVGDALAANWSHPFPVIAVKCLAHARQQFTEIEEIFPEPCRYVREVLAAVYRFEAETRTMTPDQRLAHHQRYSAPVLEELQRWISEQFTQRLVEPNSVLGKALAYLQRHWEGLTQFLRYGQAPLDTNVVERVLKRVVLHRKNALFFRTEHGAAVGDILMSVIETCRANGVPAWEYLVKVVRNRRAVREDPARWLPWTDPSVLSAAQPT